MIYAIILSIFIIILAVYGIRKVLSGSSKTTYLPSLPQKVESGVTIITLSDLSVLWLDAVPDTPVVANIGVETTESQPTMEANTQEPYKMSFIKSLWHEEDIFIEYLITCIDENINTIKDKHYDSFSFGNVVYLTSGALWKYIRAYALPRNIKDALDRNNRVNILLLVVDELKKRDITKTQDIKDAHFSAKYTITSTADHVPVESFQFLIPLVSSHFKIEKRKEGFLKEIAKVELCSDPKEEQSE